LAINFTLFIAILSFAPGARGAPVKFGIEMSIIPEKVIVIGKPVWSYGSAVVDLPVRSFFTPKPSFRVIQHIGSGPGFMECFFWFIECFFWFMECFFWDTVTLDISVCIVVTIRPEL
jgi:hypothetical protein